MSAAAAAPPRLVPAARRATARLARRRIGPLIAGLICLAAFGLRLIGLAQAGLDGDEAFSAQMALRDWPDLIATLAGGEPHPPLYYGSLGMWAHLAGTSEIALRVPTVAAGTMLVAVLYQTGRLIGGARLGLLTAAIVAMNAYQVWYAQEARMYVPAELFGAIGLAGALRALATRRALWYAISAGGLYLAALTHYYAVFLAVGIALVVAIALFRAGRRRELGWWAISLAAAALAYLPWLLYARRIIATHQLAPAGAVDVGAVLGEAALRYTLGPAVGPGGPWVGATMWWLLLALGGLWALRRRPAGLALVAACLLTPIALGAAVSTVRPMFETRYFMVAAPALYLCIAAGLASYLERRPVFGVPLLVVAVVALVVPLASHLADPGRKSDFKLVAQAILRDLRPGDAVVLDGRSQEPQFWYYVRNRGASLVPSYAFPDPDRPVEPALAAVLDRHTGVWLLDYDVGAFDPDRRVERFLSENAGLALTRRPATSRTSYYVSPTGLAATSRLVALPFEIADPAGRPVLRLASVRLPAGAVAPGDLAPADLEWQVTTLEGPAPAVVADYAVSRRLVDGAGRVVWQRDGRPLGGFRPTSEWRPGETVTDRAALVVPDYLPPGEYRLVAVVYPTAGGAAATVSPAVPGDQIPLGTVTVVDGRAANRLADAPVPPVTGPRLDGLRLIGLQLPRGDLRPGAGADLSLLWTADGGAPADPRLQALLPDGTVLFDLPVGQPEYPPGAWPSGRRVLQSASLVLPPTLENGRYQISVRLRDGAGVMSPAVPVGEVSVAGRSRVMSAPSVDRPLDAPFGDVARLTGYDLTRGGEAGAAIRPRLVWQALRTADRPYQLFVHLVDARGQIVVQRDLPPGGEAAPTTSWLPGEYLETPVDLPLPASLQPGEYRILIGLYDPRSGVRLATPDGADHLELTRLSLP